jgi:predicted PurR-regulated permease PerM
MPQGETRSKLAGGLVATAAFIIVVAGMRDARELVVPLLMASFVAIVCLPGVTWLEKRRLPRGVAMTAVLFALVAGGGAIAAMAWRSLDRLAAQLPGYKARLKDDVLALKAMVEDTALPGWLRERINSEALVEAFDPSRAFDLVGTFAGQVGNVLTNGFLILLLVIFVLVESHDIRDRIGAGSDDPDASRARFDRALAEINRYMGLKTLSSLMTGAVIAGWLAILGVDFPLLWGSLAFLLNFVPSLGSILAAVPAVLLAFVQGGAAFMGWALLAYLVVNILVGNVLEPKIMGKGLGLSTLVVFLSLVFWGWVLGPMGMILSVPLTMTVKIGLESSSEGRTWASWLGPSGV